MQRILVASMKTLSLFIVFLTLTCLFSQSALGKHKKIILVADPWCPYNCDTSNLENQGIIIDLANDVFVKKGFKVKYKNVPWTRAIAMVLSGQAAGLVGVGKEEVPNLIFPKKSILTAKHSLFTLAGDKWLFNGNASLNGRRIGAVKAYSYGDFSEKYLTNDAFGGKSVFYVHGSEPFELLIPMLLSGRIDTIVAEESVLAYHLTQNRYPVKLRNAGSVSLEEIYIGFSPKFSESTQLANDLDADLSDELVMKYLRKYVGVTAVPRPMIQK